MHHKIQISATIVLYKEQEEVLLRAVHSFLGTSLTKHLFLVDNSPKPLLNRFLQNHPEITYIFNEKNLGFTKAQNLIIHQIEEHSKYHLVLNPDTNFTSEILEELVNELERNEEVALIAPAVKFPNGSHQYSVRKYPSFFDLIIRKFNIYKSRIHKGEYRNIDLSKPFYPDAIHGSFLLFKTKDFINIQGFDERYFMYLEDIDICKKIDTLGKKKLYYPKVYITHVLRKESAKSSRLFFYHFSSAVKYFLKWL
ncbi:glycosyltransferase [Tenacibaculum sp. MEBiC06402]|uniref:glycosyltransferase n=1 Tax=unclassified Tenacibaculum TaxID=2635139 RepID=UPI003B9C4C84